MGAQMIEKHFTLDRTMEGPDHQSSLEPDELKQMVSAIRNIEKAMGDGVKKPSPSEQKNLAVVRRSIHLARNLKKEHVLKEDDVIMKRPGDGIPPKQLDLVIGRRLVKDLEEDHKLTFEDFE
jgi:sialic acid synthase SpsE